jgi:hypothetical protein
VKRGEAAFLLLTRFGFAARGVLYLLVGYLALYFGRAEDAGEALGHLRSGGSRTILAAIAIGFAGYGSWRLVDAALDTEGKGRGVRGIGARLARAVSGFIHLGLGFKALRLFLGDDGAKGGSSETAEVGAATAMNLPGGNLLLFAAAAILFGIAAGQIFHALRGRFRRHLAPQAARNRWIVAIGISGFLARGLLFGMAGWLAYRSAIDHLPAEAGGLGDALGSLPDSVQTLAAAGLALFGLFSLIEARYRIIRNPRLGDRIARARGR